MELIDTKPIRSQSGVGSLGVSQVTRRWSFTTTGTDDLPVWDRYLEFDGQPVVHIGNTCDTCEFLFSLIDDGVPSTVVCSASEQTELGLKDLDSPAVSMYVSLLQPGVYTSCLMAMSPTKASVGIGNDYFTNEQADAWGNEHEPSQNTSDYYRAGSRSIGGTDLLVELAIPLQDNLTLNQERIDHYRQLIRDGYRPTAVAIGVLDIKQHWDAPSAHWVFANYLIDGHHKVEAAAIEHSDITLLTYVSHDYSWKAVEQLMDDYRSRS